MTPEELEERKRLYREGCTPTERELRAQADYRRDAVGLHPDPDRRHRGLGYLPPSASPAMSHVPGAFHPWLLRVIIDAAMFRWPGCTFTRSGNNTGNICILDYDGDYVGVIELTNPPELTALD